MNREVDKEKDIHDGICLALFILFLFFLLIMIGRRSFVLSDPLPDEQLVIDGTEEILPTFDPKSRYSRSGSRAAKSCNTSAIFPITAPAAKRFRVIWYACSAFFRRSSGCAR